jgi:hypothetical protein
MQIKYLKYCIAGYAFQYISKFPDVILIALNYDIMLFTFSAHAYYYMHIYFSRF